MYHYSKKKTEELKLQLYYHAYKACLNEVTTVDDMPQWVPIPQLFLQSWGIDHMTFRCILGNRGFLCCWRFFLRTLNLLNLRTLA